MVTPTVTGPAMRPLDAPPPRSTDLQRVWEPIAIGRTRLRNRVMTTAHTLLYGEGGSISDRHIAYYVERARGGIGLLMTEQHAVDSHSLGAYRGQCAAFDPRCVERFAALADAVHAHGAKQFVQLFATGAQGSATGALGLEHWGPLRAPSTVPTASYRETPYAMGNVEIAELIAAFATSAEHVLAGGLDGIEIHATHGYLLGQFLSPIYNRRTDAYGGSAAARCRLLIEVLTAIRGRIGDAIPLGIRFGFHDYMGERGITPESASEQLHEIADTGLIDFVDISAGNYHTNRFGYELDRTSPGAMGVMDTPGGFNLGFAAQAHEIVAGRSAVLTVGGIRDLTEVESALAQGAADVIGMTRAHLADPHVVRKHAEGRADEVIHCVSANECTNRLVLGREVTCVVNPIVGRERTWGHATLSRTIAPRRITVVGGGPAGLRFAATAAGRGHEVRLLESRAELGGHLALWASLPGRGRWAIGVAEQVAAAARAGVALERDAEPDCGAILSADPDMVVLATGASWDTTGFSVLRPDRDALPGIDSIPVSGLDDAIRLTLADPHALGDSVVMIDETGGFPPLGLALRLAGAGVAVEIVSPFIVGEHAIRTMDAKAHFPTLLDLGVRMTSGHAVQEINPGSVTLRSVWGGPYRAIDGVDAVVLSTTRTPNLCGLETLVNTVGVGGGTPETRLLGDVRAPRSTVEVIAEAEGFARNID